MTFSRPERGSKYLVPVELFFVYSDLEKNEFVETSVAIKKFISNLASTED